MTARSRGSSAWRCCCARRARARPTDERAGGLLDRAQDELRDEPRGAARAGPRHPSGGADRARARAGAAGAGRARAGARDGRGRRPRAPPGPRRVRHVLRRLRGARQRREVRPGDPRHGGGPARQRQRRRRCHATTASAVRTRPRAQACAGSPTASPRSTARSRSTARPGHGTRLHAEIPCAPAPTQVLRTAEPTDSHARRTPSCPGSSAPSTHALDEGANAGRLQ